MEQPRKKGRFTKIKCHHIKAYASSVNHNYAKMCQSEPEVEVEVKDDKDWIPPKSSKKEQVVFLILKILHLLE